jgi:hypothetical protein
MVIHIRNIKILLIALFFLGFIGAIGMTERLNIILAGKDTLTFTYPLFHMLSTNLNAGQFPLWDRFVSYPVHAESQGGFCYPIQIILALLLPLPFAYMVNVVVHLFLGAWFAYILAKELGLSPSAAVLTAISFSWGGFFTARIDTLFVLNNGIWMPLVIYFIERGIKKYRILDWIGAGCALGMALLAGHFQYTFMTVLFSTAYLVFRLWGRHEQNGALWDRLRPLAFWPLILMLSIGLAAVQLVPTAELLFASDRSSLTYDLFSGYSLFPLQLLGLVCPFLFGITMPSNFALPFLDSAGDYWGFGSFWESSGYVGLLPLVLAISFLRFRGKQPQVFFTYGILISILLAFGKFTPLVKVLYHLPGFNLFRIPARFLFLSCFATTILAGFGLDHLRSIGWDGLRLIKRMSQILLLFTVSLVIFSLNITLYSKPIKKGITGVASQWLKTRDRSDDFQIEKVAVAERKITAKTSNMIRALSLSNRHLIIWVILTLTAAAVLLGFSTGQWNKSALTGCILAVTIIDIAFFSGVCIRTQIGSADIVRNPPAPARFLAKQTPTPFRIYTSQDELRRVPNPYALLHPNYTRLFSLDTFTFRSSIKEQHFGHIENLLFNSQLGLISKERPPINRHLEENLALLNLYSLLNIKYILCQRELQNQNLKKVYEWDGIKIYENLQVLPRAYIVKKAQLIQGKDQELNALLKHSHPYRQTVILGKKPASVKHPIGAGPVRQDHIRIESYQDTAVDLRVFSETGGFLVLADFFYPGWTATIDGRPTEIYRGNYVQRTVLIPAGSHTIQFRYRPWSVIAGFWISAISIIVVLFLGGRWVYQKRFSDPKIR